MKKKAWILQDYRVGNTTQTKALAEHLNLDYAIKKIEYNIFAYLPNWLLSGRVSHVDKNKSDSLDEDLPDVVISAGRRCAVIAQYLKSRKPNLKTIQIMRPLHKDNKFDYIIVPTHDNYGSRPNILPIVGALNDVQNQIAKAPHIKEIYPRINEFIGIIIGGDNRMFGLNADDSMSLSSLINLFVRRAKLHPVITFSRRTSKDTKSFLRRAFSADIIYDPEKDSGKPNIYYSLLKSARFIICTADSISMCSEIASSGKPFYIYKPNELNKSTKHENFANMLLENRIAKLLNGKTEPEHYEYTPLNEVSRIAKLIQL